MNGKRRLNLRQRIQRGDIRREDVIRRLAELAFGRVNDCVKLAVEEKPELNALDLALLSEVKRNEKGMVEIKLIDRLKVLEQLERIAGCPKNGAEETTPGLVRFLNSGQLSTFGILNFKKCCT